MNDMDVSIVLNIHREAYFLVPTLRSLDFCALEAKSTMIKVELIAVFDRTDPITSKIFQSIEFCGFDTVSVVECNFGSIGLARNVGIRHAKGEFIWLSNAGDLVSRNAVVELHKTISNYPLCDTVVLLEYLVHFGGSCSIARYYEDKWLTAADFAFSDHYASRLFTRRAILEQYSYSDVKATAGAFAYEDWDMNNRLFFAKFKFLIANNTILFFRKHEINHSHVVASFSTGLPPHSPLFTANIFRSFMNDAREQIDDWDAFLAIRNGFHHINLAQELLSCSELERYIIDAAKLEPLIDPRKIEAAQSFCTIPVKSDHWGFQLEKLYQLLGNNSFSDVLLLPYLNPGGGEKYILQIIEELHEIGASDRLLVITGQPADRHEWIGRLPKGSVFVDLYNFFPSLDDLGMYAMLARALMTAPIKRSRLHIKTSHFGHRMLEIYGKDLQTCYSIIYYRFSDAAYTWRGRTLSEGSYGINFLQKQLPNIDLIISDCRHIVERDLLRLGPTCNKTEVIYAKCDKVSKFNSNSQPQMRLLWASRISSEKRPSLLSLIGHALTGQYRHLKIHAYGNPGAEHLLRCLTSSPNIVYEGSFDSFDQLPLDTFDAFLYTSAYDGLPNVLIEAMQRSIPVIAPDIGGIRELVISEKTGFLVPNLDNDKELVAAYIAAIGCLYNDFSLSIARARKGQDLVLEQHGADSFRQRVAQVYAKF